MQELLKSEFDACFSLCCIRLSIRSFVGALLTRFFLGFVEAAFFPGSLFLISKWYKRDEVGLRTAILYGGNIISNAFGALIASGILSGMQGKLGHEAWRFVHGTCIFYKVIYISIT
jgi:MFS family permease